MAISETAAPIKQSRAQNFVQMRNALPLAGLFLALLVNAAWIRLVGLRDLVDDQIGELQRSLRPPF